MRRILILIIALLPLTARGQYNINRLLTSGQVALHYEDYVLSIQYFNQIIALKPHLYLPWHLRAVAKFYLDDFVGAEVDATEAMSRNPYVKEIYDLRAISLIRQRKFEAAIADYDKAIKMEPSVQSFRYNRAICLMNIKDYDHALQETDTIIRRWSTYTNAYTLKAEIYLQMADTVKAAEWLDKSIELNPYDADTWTTRSYISLSQKDWRQADEQLSRAIHLKPKTVSNYLNRAVARVNYNNLRGAMDDYDLALDLDPNNFLGHYNRGLLRMQLGDDNRAIADFDYVISMEPDNIMAIFNRGVLNDRTGNLVDAIRDYTTVIDQFPNFWTGLANRASCYRRLGMKDKAELDEFKILKAQMDKHIGIQPRWSKETLKKTRKRSEIDPDKYNQLVVEDEQTVEHEYKSEYRGHVQNRKIVSAYMPMFEVSYLPYFNGVNTSQIFDHNVEAFNTQYQPSRRLYLTCQKQNLGKEQSEAFFSFIDTLSARIDDARSMAETLPLIMQRAVAYSVTQNYEAAINDFTVLLQNDSTSVLSSWQRAVCQAKMNDYRSTQGVDVRLQGLKVADDFAHAIAHDSNNQYLYYDRACLLVGQGKYEKAIDDFTLALQIDPFFAEAYFNRGLAHLDAGHTDQAIADLSKAGELGIYDAYSIIKRISSGKKP